MSRKEREKRLAESSDDYAAAKLWVISRGRCARHIHAIAVLSRFPIRVLTAT